MHYPSIRAVSRKLEAFRFTRADTEGKGRCPAHDDKSPSLSVKQDGGRLLLHCFAGCEYEAIVEALEQRGVTFPKAQPLKFSGRRPGGGCQAACRLGAG